MDDEDEEKLVIVAEVESTSIRKWMWSRFARRSVKKFLKNWT